MHERRELTEPDAVLSYAGAHPLFPPGSGRFERAGELFLRIELATDQIEVRGLSRLQGERERQGAGADSFGAEVAQGVQERQRGIGRVDREAATFFGDHAFVESVAGARLNRQRELHMALIDANAAVDALGAFVKLAFPKRHEVIERRFAVIGCE